VVLDNHGYQCILGLQRAVGVADFGNELRYRDAKSGLLTGDIIPVDFRKHAEAMGAHAILAQTPEELTQALVAARKTHRVTVIVVPVDPEKRMPATGGWWDVPVAAVSESEKTRQTRESYEKATVLQRTIFT
jgi:3D-(3,5/4)-trihydroxycyclohexane-1,2-dione acylhydrolase (decyclizing)